MVKLLCVVGGLILGLFLRYWVVMALASDAESAQITKAWTAEEYLRRQEEEN